MNDTHRLDWLERNPDRLICRRLVTENAHVFSTIYGEPGKMKHTKEYPSLRDAIDEAMEKEI